jgi:hypothetical protein
MAIFMYRELGEIFGKVYSAYQNVLKLFIIYVLVVAASGIYFFPDLCHPTYPPSAPPCRCKRNAPNSKFI